VREEDVIQDVLMDPGNINLDRASSNFDMRHRLVAHFIFEVPRIRPQSKLGRVLTGGWQLSGILSFQSGLPFQVLDGGVPELFGSARPRVTGHLPVVSDEEDMIKDPSVPNRFLYLRANPIRIPVLGSCIDTAAPFGCFGSIDDTSNLLSRNYYRRPGSHFQDVAVTRNVAVGERTRLQLRAEFYNILNHANLELVPGTLGGYWLNQPVFAEGRIPGVVARYGGTPRQIVVAARVIF
jgi:hypothetical protein